MKEKKGIMDSRRTNDVYAISIMSKDRVGIIADVSEKIAELHGDITDIRQSVLCGYFTMILLVSFPQDTEQRSIETKIASITSAEKAPLLVSVKSVNGNIESESKTVPENNYVLTVTGRDQIGFVAAVTRFCAEKGINILDLSTTQKNENYVMILFIDLSRSSGIDSLRESLLIFQKQTGYEMVLQHFNIFRAVNEIDLPAI